MQRIEVSRSISCPPAIVKSAFWDIEKWNVIWKLIDTVRVVYSDGRHQEFLMSVWRGGICEHVRTVRFRNQNSIDFFSPEPPPMMSFHRGKWSFRRNEKSTVVTAVREYNLKMVENEDNKSYENRCRTFDHQFTKRLTLILETFESFLNSKR